MRDCFVDPIAPPLLSISPHSGIVLDPYEGSRAPGHMAVVGAVAGFFKAMAGLMLRPSIGILEATSKLLQGAGLACTGKRGIQASGGVNNGENYACPHSDHVLVPILTLKPPPTHSL